MFAMCDICRIGRWKQCVRGGSIVDAHSMHSMVSVGRSLDLVLAWRQGCADLIDRSINRKIVLSMAGRTMEGPYGCRSGAVLAPSLFHAMSTLDVRQQPQHQTVPPHTNTVKSTVKASSIPSTGHSEARSGVGQHPWNLCTPCTHNPSFAPPASRALRYE